MRRYFVVLFLVVWADVAMAQKDVVGRGTINVVLANPNGMVVLTDSRITGVIKLHPLETVPMPPGEKLFQLDGATVCTFAGFASAPKAENFPELVNSTAGILRGIQKQLANYPQQPFDTKLIGASSIVEMRLATMANVRTNPDTENYRLQFILAGYDTDGTAKIQKMEIKVVNGHGGTGTSVFEVTTSHMPLKKVDNSLTWELAGLKDTADQILNHPEDFSQDPVIAQYAKAKAANRGSSLSVKQMKDLALAIKRHTEENPVFSSFVGDSPQIAVFEKGHITSVEKPPFPEPTSDFPFILTIAGPCTDTHECYAGRGVHYVVLKTKFERVAQTVLDDNFFFSNDFSQCGIMYDGGLTRFDTSNKVTHCSLFLGPHANTNPTEVEYLKKSFTWDAIKPL